MAKKSGIDTTASHTAATNSLSGVQKHFDDMKTRIADLEDENDTLTAELAAEKAEHAKDVARLQAAYDRDVAALKAQVSERDDKLRRVLVTLS
jgi:peptidoglycan hydrolase CwlO-like protein